MTQAACTIVSFNYLHYARVLCASFRKHHPDTKFYVLLVDRLPHDFDPANEPFEFVLVENLGIPNFPSIAFKYDVLELNTNVKPTFLKSLLDKGNDSVVYLDPDIFIYRPLDPVFKALEQHAIVLTPHVVSPHPNDHGLSERSQLKNGIYNLGFIAVRKDPEATRFLSWWEDRCMHYAYAAPESFLFVDQKWIDFAPCFFNSIGLLKHQGCNVAYWNLYERYISGTNGNWIVNNRDPLVFYHFSGIRIDGGDRISKHMEVFNLSNRPDLRPLFEGYRRRLSEQSIHSASSHRYAFGAFDDGSTIAPLARWLYAANLERFQGDNPFASSSEFYAWARAKGAIRSGGPPGVASKSQRSDSDSRFLLANKLLRLMLRVFGPDRYMLLIKYLSYVIVVENQKIVLGD